VDPADKRSELNEEGPEKVPLVPTQSDHRLAQAKTIDLGSDMENCVSDSADEIDEDLIGTRLDIYQILSLLGAGGMGRVYLAWHERLERLCALKVIAPEIVRFEPYRLDMFFREARTAAKLQHPNIVTVHSLGHDRGYHFIEMEYIGGTSLREMAGSGHPLSVSLAIQLVAQVASGLAAAHQRDLIHADVKPDNVMVTAELTAKLTDFGLARARAVPGGSSGLVGTPSFMAPELFTGSGPSVASDVYALGVTLYAVLAGRLPFYAETIAEMEACHRQQSIPSVRSVRPSLPMHLDELVSRMMAKDPAERPVSCAELSTELHQVANGLVELKILVDRAMNGLDVDWQQEGERFRFVVPLSGTRQQFVFADVIDSDPSGGQLISFWSPCAPTDAAHFQFVLQLNSQLPFGAVSIRTFEGRPHFVMLENHQRGTLDPEEIRTAVLHVARWADHVEQRITGNDRF
jgi:serine/threonine-protein kinase